MKPLPHDTARCLGADCKERDNCARYTQRGTPQKYQVTIGRGDVDPNTGKCAQLIKEKE